MPPKKNTANQQSGDGKDQPKRRRQLAKGEGMGGTIGYVDKPKRILANLATLKRPVSSPPCYPCYPCPRTTPCPLPTPCCTPTPYCTPTMYYYQPTCYVVSPTLCCYPKYC